MKIIRRTVLLVSMLACFGAVAQSPAWPAKSIKFVNNFPPGGPSDMLARSVADVLQNTLKQTIIVENKAGASGNIGADFVAKSAADGYTVLFGIDSAFTVNPHIYKNMAFKAADLKPIMIMASSGLLIGVHPSSNFKNMADLIASAKAKPANFSSGGSGSPGHMSAEMFMDAAGVKIQHIPYKGNTPAVTAVMSGEVTGGALATPGMLPFVKAGKITALAVTSSQRSKLAPDIPTVAEAGLKNLEQEVLYVAMVPSATPDAVVQILQRGFAEALAKPEVRTRLENLDLHYEGASGEVASKRLSDLSARYARIVKSTGMQVE